MSFNNAPILTTTELLEHVNLLVGDVNIADTALVRATKNALTAFGDKLKNKFYLMLPVAPGSSHLNVGELGIEHVSNVWWSYSNDGPWDVVLGWELNDHILSVWGPHIDVYPRIWVKIEHWQNPDWGTQQGTLSHAFVYTTSGGGEMRVAVADDTLRLPFAGYVRVGTSPDSDWFEYQALYYDDDPVTTVRLMLSTKQPWAHQIGTAFAGEAVVWGIGFPGSTTLDAVVKQAASYFWAYKTATCNSDEDRSTAMQLMNFWSGEAEKAWKMVGSARKSRIKYQPQPRGYYAFASN